jgi:intracellular septation protein
LHDETFIKWKPTVLYWLSGAALIAGQLLFKKNGIRGILGKQVTLPDRTWKSMNLSWGIFFLLLGATNLFVAYTFSTDAWVNFKLFGIMGLILAFIVVQGLIIGPKIRQEKQQAE